MRSRLWRAQGCVLSLAREFERRIFKHWVLTIPAGLVGAASAAVALAQSVPPEPPAPEIEQVVVSGYRASLKSAVDLKRQSDVMVDAINAEDIAQFPDANLAESLQRLPGVSIDRENGEGRTISVRGLGSDFTRVRLNGLEALSTAGSTQSGSSPNRSRGFDFNTFASELFSQLRIQKTSSAETDEGSLGATVDLLTGRPFDIGGRRSVLSAQDAYYENGGHHNPRLAGLVSDQWLDGRLGALFSAAYNNRKQTIDSYQRTPNVFDYTYRQSTQAGVTPLTRGFATAAQGSNPEALAQLNDLTLIPALPTLNHAELTQDRLGLTSSLQARPTEHTLLTLDLVYSRLKQDQINYQIVPVGLNRNNTNAGLLTATGATPPATKRGLYPTCTARAGTAYQDPIDCGQALYGATPVAGTYMSFNPNNLEPYDYYNDRASPGYVADPRGLAMLNAFIGRPSTQVLAAHVNQANEADYLALDNVDMRSAADESRYTTTFNQGSLALEQEITPRLHVSALYGKSRSSDRDTGLLAEFNRLDSNGFVYDERSGGSMPVMNFGFNPADAANWDFIKGFSALRHYERHVDNRYDAKKIDFSFEAAPDTLIKFGAALRQFNFDTVQYQRLTTETLNPSFLESGTSVTQMSRLINWGDGLSVPPGTPTAFLAPDLTKFRNLYGFDCNCINKWGDWRLSALSNPGNAFAVKEKDTGYYAQLDFHLRPWSHVLRGNLGVRYVITDVDSSGLSSAARPLTANNRYKDVLPALNLVYELQDNMLLRFAAAKLMARPQLSNLSPGIASLSTSLPSGTTPSVTLGNPYLKPFRAKNYDLSFEWYFAPGALFSTAVFRKDIGSFPQNVTRLAPLSEVLTPDNLSGVVSALSNQALIAYINAGGSWSVLQYEDAPGGRIDGVEVSYQQNLTFLPKPFNGLGTLLNYTHIKSELSYILNPLTPSATVKGPWVGVSPDAVNFTVFYDARHWSARISSAYRSRYTTLYPIATGTCAPGVCDSPYMNDFSGSKATLYVDGAFTAYVTDHFTVNLEALNLTEQTDDRWAYQAQPLVAQYASTGRQFFLGVRLTF